MEIIKQFIRNRRNKQDNLTQCKPDENPISPLAVVLRSSQAAPAQKVRAALLLRGESMTEQARRINKTRTSISMVLNGRLKSTAIKEAVAQDLDVAISDIWT